MLARLSFAIVVFLLISTPSISMANFSIDRTTPSNAKFPSFLLNRLDKWMRQNGFDPKLAPDEQSFYVSYLANPPPLASKTTKGFVQNFQFGVTFFDKRWAVGPLRLWVIDSKSDLHAKMVELAKKKKVSAEWAAPLVGVGLLGEKDKVEIISELNANLRTKLKSEFPKLEAALGTGHFAILQFNRGKLASAEVLELAVSESEGSRCRGAQTVSQVNRFSDSSGVAHYENYLQSFQEQAFTRPGMLVAVKVQAGMNLGPGVLSCPSGSYTLVYP